MKKSITILILVLVCALALSACGCEHEWIEPGCDTPATCAKCGKTDGVPAGHIWMAATCTDPQTCDVCGVTEGAPAGHTWEDASCEEAKHCLKCHEIEGEPLGHNWVEATTEDPKTCSNCFATEGERIITDVRFTTAANEALFGKWSGIMELTGEMMDLPEFEDTIPMEITLDFSNAGDLGISVLLADEEAFLNAIIDTTLEQSYAEFEASGMSREEADEAAKSVYGMSLEEYVRSIFQDMDLNELLSSIYEEMDLGGVYFVKDGSLYVGDSWEDDLEPSDYSLNGDELIIDSLSEELGAELIFTRVSE